MHIPLSLALFALSGSGLAIPSKRVSTLQIQNFSAHRSDSEGTLHFTIQGADSTSDHCTVSWNPKGDVQPGLVPMTDCTRRIFQFGFRYGIGNIENFSLAVRKVGGSQTAYEVISAQQKDPSWICSKDLKREDCEWKGPLNMNY